MGVRDFVNLVSDTVKSYTPELTPVKDACWSSYDYGRTAIARVDGAVRGNVGPKVTAYLPDEEGRAKIGRFVMCIGKNAVVLGFQEAVKSVPGGDLVNKIISRSLPNQKNENNLAEAMKSLEPITKEMESLKARIAELEGKPDSRRALCLDENANYMKPEDVIPNFMMKECFVRQINQEIVGNLMIPGVGHGKDQKKSYDQV